MATANPFDLLGDNDTDDTTHLVAALQQKMAAAVKPAAAVVAAPAAKLPVKPLPPAQAVREARGNVGAPAPYRGGGRGGPGRGRGGRGGGGYGYGPNRDFGNGNGDGYSGSYGGGGGQQDGDSGKAGEREQRGSFGGGPRQGYGGYRRGGYANEEAGGGGGGGDSERPPRRNFERRSGTGRGNEFKREGAGRGNWGTNNDDVVVQEFFEVEVEDKNLSPEKQIDQENAPPIEINKENKEVAAEEPEEDKEMTLLEEYEKIREEKRKALMSMKTELRKVDMDKEFQSMQQLSIKKGNDDVFIKLGAKDLKKQKDHADRDEKTKKSVSINEFLKPAEGERYYNPGGRGRGRGRGERGPFRGGFGRGPPSARNEASIKIEDPGQFPTLGGK